MRLVLLVVVVPACGASPALHRTPPTAPLAERVRAYHEHELVNVRPVQHGRRPRAILADGEVVVPDALASVVEPASTTGVALQRVTARDRRGTRWMMAGLIGSAVVGLGGAAVAVTTHHGWVVPICIAFGTGIDFGGIYLAHRVDDASQPDRDLAYRHYNEDLGAALQICTRGLDVVDCRSAAIP